MTKNKIISGIYIIENLINGKKYVGSSVDIKRRWLTHKADFKKGKGVNQHFQNSWNKYGKENFSFNILEEVEPVEDLLLEREYFWINELNLLDPNKGYNKKSLEEGVLINLSSRGSGNNSSKLKEEDIIDIVEKLKLGEKTAKVAKEYNVTGNLVLMIANNLIWRHVKRDTIDTRGTTLKKEDVVEIKKMLIKGVCCQDIAKKFKTSRQCIMDIVKGRNWKDVGYLPENFKPRPKHKITPTEVIEIKNSMRQGFRDTEIAKAYGVSITYITGIRHGRYWSNVGTLEGIGNSPNNYKLNREKVAQIKKELSEGVKPKILAEKYNVKRSHIYAIKQGRNWKDVI